MSETLYKVMTAVDWIDPWGHKHSQLGIHIRIHEVVEVEPNGEHLMFDNGYEPPYPCPVVAAPDGRTWCKIQNRVDYYGGTWYRKLFEEESAAPRPMESHGRTYQWMTEREVLSRCPVNAEGKAVDIHGNLL